LGFLLPFEPGYGYAFSELTLQNEDSQHHRNYAHGRVYRLQVQEPLV